ncbi:MAG: ribonuclease E inhibitor RraB [Bacteroidota bacterium]
MEILRFLKSKEKIKFVSENKFIENRKKLVLNSIEKLVDSRDFNIEEEDELKIEFNFYTNTLKKSEEFAKEIQKLNYTVQNQVSPNNKGLFVINGLTTEMKMMHEVLRKWSLEMCDLGYRFDCNFDSWEIILDLK